MKIPIFMIFQFMGAVSAWASTALQDGKVTAEEGLQLIITLAGILGVEPAFSMGDLFQPDATPVEKLGIDQPEGSAAEPTTVIKPEE